MSISSEITRISGNVADALTAIGNKGVTVPQGANSDDLATLIAAITGGSGGLEYETGTYEPSADTSGEKILFANTHSEAPAFIMMVDATGTADTTANTNMQFMWHDFYKLYGTGMPWSASAYRYATAFYVYRASSTSALTQGAVNCIYTSDSMDTAGSINYPRFWTDELGFTPNSASTSRYWRAGRTYKWYAIWRPT